MKLRSQNAGQAAIEFILISVVIFFFLFFFLSLSVLIVTSEYIDYATFMAARTYKAASGSPAIQQDRANKVLNLYLRDLDQIVRNVQTTFTDDGLSVSYDMNMFYLPPVFISNDRNQPVSRISLSTESRLGREPTFEECQSFFRTLLEKFGVQDIDRYLGYVDDTTC